MNRNPLSTYQVKKIEFGCSSLSQRNKKSMVQRKQEQRPKKNRYVEQSEAQVAQSYDFKCNAIFQTSAIFQSLAPCSSPKHQKAEEFIESKLRKSRA